MRSNSLLNVNTKLIFKALSEFIKNVLFCIISKSQIGYVNKRFIIKGGRLIDDLLKLVMFNREGFLHTIDNEVFD